MSPFSRVALGAAIGAFVVLVTHPLSRPYVLGGLTRFGASKAAGSTPMLPATYAVLPHPSNLIESSIWLHVAAERVLLRKEMSNSTLNELIDIANNAERRDPENAFWPQVCAVLERSRGNEQISLQIWKRAAGCSTWNDYQSSRFDKAKMALAAEAGVEQSWHSAFLFTQRSLAASILINRFGRISIRDRQFLSRNDLEARIIALKNGALLRDNSRCISVGKQGVDLVEFASLTSRQLPSTSPRKLVTTRFALIDRLREVGMTNEVEIANQAFYDNDAWLALLLPEESRTSIKNLSIASIAANALPGAFLLVSVVAFAVAFFSHLIVRFPWLMALLRNPMAPIIGLALGIIVYVSTELGFLSLTFVGCFAFLGFGPDNERSKPPLSLGPLFDMTIGLLAVLFSAFLLLFVVGITTSAMELVPEIDLPGEFFGGSTLPLWLAGIVMALMLLVAPLWALATRISTTHVLTLALRYFGFDAASFCLFFGIVTVPLAIYTDTILNPILSKILLNEPTYYLTR